MDELKDKFKALLSKPSKKLAGFKGQGHRLGSAEAAPPPQHQARPAAPAPPAAASSSRAAQQHWQQQPAQGATSPSANLQQQGPSSQRQSVDPRQELKPATEFSPFTAVIGGGAACTTTKMNPAHLADSQPSPVSQGAGRRLGTAEPAQQQQHAAPAPVPQAQVSPEVQEELQHCLALVSSQPDVAVGSMEVLHKLLSNLLTTPQEAKFRQLRLGPNPNPKIQASVLEVSGALDLLKACGFEVHADEPGAGQDAEGTFAYFLDDAKLSYVEAGLAQLQLALQVAREAQQGPGQQQQQQQPQQQQLSQAPAQPGAAATPAAASSGGVSRPAASAAAAAVPQAVARNTLVLLPAAPDADVPEWFFERTAAEVKAEFMSLLRQRQAKEVFASKAWKDLKLAGSSSSSSTGKQQAAVTLRVRFPEGVCLQGSFSTREPVTAVFDWVTGSLRHPGLTYELITPKRSPLAVASGTVGAADLAGAVLNFRGLSHTQRGYLVDGAGRQLPFLSDALLQRAQAD